MTLKEFRKYILPQLEVAKELGVLTRSLEKEIVDTYKEKKKNRKKEENLC